MKRILVASEEPALRRLVVACLRKHDFHILHHDDLKSLAEHAEHVSPDLLILDHRFLNGQSAAGLDALPLEKCREYKLLLISDKLSYAPDEAAAGADGVLERPFSPPSLRKSIKCLLG